jgi:hypothetical protein
MDTVRIEYMMVNERGEITLNWTTLQGSIENNPQIYVPRAFQVKNGYGEDPKQMRVRVISEQTNRIVDLFP